MCLHDDRFIQDMIIASWFKDTDYWNTSTYVTTAVYKSISKYTFDEIEEMDKVLRYYKGLED